MAKKKDEKVKEKEAETNTEDSDEVKSGIDKKLKIIIALVIVLIICALGVIAFLFLNGGDSDSTSLNISQVLGKWTLEIVSSEDIGMLSVGPAYLGYNDFFGEKNDASIRFNEDETFVITGLAKEHTGTYIIDEDNSSKKAIMVLMTFHDAEEMKDYTETYGIYSVRKSATSGESISLTFSYLNDIYSFIK